MSGTTVFGFQCKVYVETTQDPMNIDYPEYAELSQLADAVLNLGFTEADATTRAASGLEVVEPGLFQVEVTGKLQWRNGPYTDSDAVFDVVRTAARTRTPILARVLTGASDNLDARGMFGHWKITKFPINQELKELVAVDFAMKPCWSTIQLVEADEGAVPVVAIIGEVEE
jgi:hypothetical protein